MTIETERLSSGPNDFVPSVSLTTKPAKPPRDRARGRSTRKRWTSVLKHVIMIAAGLIMLYPLLWMIASSLRPNDVIFSQPGIILKSFETSNYTNGWTALTFPFGKYLMNSAILVLGSVIGNLFSCSITAYAFARLNFRFKRPLFALMLITIMIPVHVIIVPQYIIFSKLGLINTFVPLLLPKFLAADAFFIFLMVQFIRAIPKDIDEAARIDGAGHARIFFQVILPLMTPALAATTVFTFINSWNDFFGPLIYLTSPDKLTAPIALRSFIDSTGSSAYGPMFAMSIVSLVPVFLAFLIGQKYLVKGIATTGLK
ncbi:carbohydrate ABC transporter permease [Frondihabitans cladoniiphilus]|uniref:Carbohydrate ABC transporter permease n=1 Tax=Frondihabitans cladoniiphilus TaxID=715785 RepID=A0ABP8W6H4_9MICO